MKLKIFLTSILVILFLSCNTANQPIIKVRQPPPYSFLHTVDPNATDEEYVERMEKYDRILAKSPIPIFIIGIKDFSSEIFLKIGDPISFQKITKLNILGMYFYGKPLEDWPSEFIFINKGLTPEQIMVTYFHEIGHYLHRNSGCEGCSSNPVTRETHAIYNELKMGWEYNVPHVLESSIRTMAIYAIDPKANMIYKMATFEVMQTDLWKQTMGRLILFEEKMGQ